MFELFALTVRLLIRILPKKSLSIFEIYIQERQGKGYVSNVELEVDALISLLPQDSEHPLYALDVGANEGGWTRALKAKLPTAKVDLFEPNIFHRDALVSLQSTEADLCLFFVGLADSDMEVSLYSDTQGSTMASLLSRDLGHLNLNFKDIGKVPVMKLDTILATALIHPTVMKIDVEGYELKVLQGATESLKFFEVLQFEFGGTALDSRIFFKDFWNILHPDFTIFRLAPFGLIEIKQYSESDEVFRFSNYFAVRKHSK